jgi:hypothetical protein
MSDDVTYRPGEGPTANVSVSLHSGNIAAVRARVGKRGFSASWTPQSSARSSGTTSRS